MRREEDKLCLYLRMGHSKILPRLLGCQLLYIRSAELVEQTTSGNNNTEACKNQFS